MSYRQTNATQRRRNVRNGAFLAFAETAQLVNVPLAHDVAGHLHKLFVALKAPKENDLDAQALMDSIEEVISVLDAAARGAEGMEAHSEASFGQLTELQRFCEIIQAIWRRLSLSSMTFRTVDLPQSSHLKPKSTILLCERGRNFSIRWLPY